MKESSERLNISALTLADLKALTVFYADLTEAVTSLYQPYGPIADEYVISARLKETDEKRNLDFGIWTAQREIVGHGFVWRIDSPGPIFGIGLAERFHGQGWGRRLAERVLGEADRQEVGMVTLTVLKVNVRARTLYETIGFSVAGEASFRAESDSWYMERFRPRGTKPAVH